MLKIEHIQAISDLEKQGVVNDGTNYTVTKKDGTPVLIPVSDIQATVSQFGTSLLAIKQAIATNQAYLEIMTAFGATINTFMAQNPLPDPSVVPDVAIDENPVDPTLTP